MLVCCKEIAMRLNQLAGGVVLAGLIAGCMHKPAEEPIITADPGMFARVRADLQRMDPNAHIGQVTEVSPAENRVAVGSIVTDGLKDGDIVTFMDGAEKSIATGKIIRVLPDSIHVKYDAPPVGGRVPVEGDIAIRFK